MDTDEGYHQLILRSNRARYASVIGEEAQDSAEPAPNPPAALQPHELL